MVFFGNEWEVYDLPAKRNSVIWSTVQSGPVNPGCSQGGAADDTPAGIRSGRPPNTLADVAGNIEAGGPPFRAAGTHCFGRIRSYHSPARLRIPGRPGQAPASNVPRGGAGVQGPPGVHPVTAPGDAQLQGLGRPTGHGTALGLLLHRLPGRGLVWRKNDPLGPKKIVAK